MNNSQLVIKSTFVSRSSRHSPGADEHILFQPLMKDYILLLSQPTLPKLPADYSAIVFLKQNAKGLDPNQSIYLVRERPLST